MAVDLSTAVAPLHTETITMATTITQVSLPPWCRRVTIRFVSIAGRITHTGADGAALGAEHYVLAANTDHELTLSHGGQLLDTDRILRLAAASGTPTAHLLIERG